MFASGTSTAKLNVFSEKSPNWTFEESRLECNRKQLCDNSVSDECESTAAALCRPLIFRTSKLTHQQKTMNKEFNVDCVCGFEFPIVNGCVIQSKAEDGARE